MADVIAKKKNEECLDQLSEMISLGITVHLGGAKEDDVHDDEAKSETKNTKGKKVDSK